MRYLDNTLVNLRQRRAVSFVSLAKEIANEKLASYALDNGANAA
jgi:hypothetical protein